MVTKLYKRQRLPVPNGRDRAKKDKGLEAKKGCGAEAPCRARVVGARASSMGCLVWLVDVSMDVDGGSGVIGDVYIGRGFVFR